MTAPEPPEAERAPPRRRFLRQLHERTWELELLLSGAVIFVLYRLPGAVDAAYRRIEPGLGGTASMAGFMLWYYLKLILYTLLAAFVVHLASRAYWVGLVGLDSVFPRGIRWAKVQQGPLSRQLYREKIPSLPRMIRSADSVCSVIFSVAFALIAIFVMSLAIAGVAGFAGLLISRLAFDGERPAQIAVALFLLFVLPSTAAGLIDRWRGDRLDPEGRTARLLRGLMRVSYFVTGAGFWLPTSQTLATNLRRRTFLVAGGLFFFGLIAFFLTFDVLVPRGRLGIEASPYLPADAGALGVDGRYYESERPPGEIFPNTPSIRSDVVDGPYLRLSIPMRAKGLEERVVAACPDLEPVDEARIRLGRPPPPPPPEAVRPVLDCLAGLWRVELNGEPLEDLDYRFQTRPQNRLHGLVAYLPTAGMPGGANLLTVTEVRDDRPPESHFIPFWRPGEPGRSGAAAAVEPPPSQTDE